MKKILILALTSVILSGCEKEEDIVSEVAGEYKSVYRFKDGIRTLVNQDSIVPIQKIYKLAPSTVEVLFESDGPGSSTGTSKILNVSVRAKENAIELWGIGAIIARYEIDTLTFYSPDDQTETLKSIRK